MKAANNNKVLIVDSNSKNAGLIEGYIQPCYCVLRAESGEKCLDLIEKEHVDLVIMAGVLPGIDGYETCKKIKGNARTNNIPVIMIPALQGAQEKMRSLHAGADDFIAKPFAMHEVVARIKSVLKIKEIESELVRSNESLNALISCTSWIYRNFSSSKFDEKEFYKNMVKMLLRKNHSEKEKPAYIFVGKADRGEFSGAMYGAGSEPFNCTIAMEFYKDKLDIDKGSGFIYSNQPNDVFPLLRHENLRPEMAKVLSSTDNYAGYISNNAVFIAFNYGRSVGLYDAQIIKGLAIHAPFLKMISSQRQDMEEAFAYTVNALSRAGESDIEDTEKHILRMSRYAAVIARNFGLPEKFIGNIGIAAQLHDVGNVYISRDILKKPSKLLPEELDSVKQHPLYGARLLGEHPKLKMAHNVALSHHENWDGSGYPYGLKGGMIPIEARIVSIADKYDVLRSKRAYRSPLSHVEACMIIAEGDNRLAPSHFDPDLHKVFKSVSRDLEDIFEALK